MGMLRTLVVVGAGIAIMPSPPPSATDAAGAAPVSSFAYLAAAAETVADMRSFCQRNPNVCVTAGAVAQTLEGKAKYSAKLVYEWANEAQGNGHPAALPDDMADLETDTLSADDRKPVWRKPKPLPQG
jgi:hypothetical protein